MLQVGDLSVQKPCSALGEKLAVFTTTIVFPCELPLCAYVQYCNALDTLSIGPFFRAIDTVIRDPNKIRAFLLVIALSVSKDL